MPTASASFVNRTTGVREETTTAGPADSQIVAFLHTPVDRPPRAAVLMLSSLYEDLQLHYRREILMARHLAQRGFAVARFHYRGTGNSAPLPDEAVTFDTMLRDAGLMEGLLLERTARAPLVLYADKLGALVATELRRNRPGAPLVLVSPVLTGADYFRGLVRASKVVGLRSRASEDVSFQEQLARSQRADVFGHAVHARSYADLSARALAEPQPGSGPTLVIQLSSADSLSTSLRSLVDRLREAGVDAEAVVLRQRERWFVPDQWEPDNDVPDTHAISEGVSAWLEKQVP